MKKRLLAVFVSVPFMAGCGGGSTTTAPAEPPPTPTSSASNDEFEDEDDAARFLEQRLDDELAPVANCKNFTFRSDGDGGTDLVVELPDVSALEEGGPRALDERVAENLAIVYAAIGEPEFKPFIDPEQFETSVEVVYSDVTNAGDADLAARYRIPGTVGASTDWTAPKALDTLASARISYDEVLDE